MADWSSPGLTSSYTNVLSELKAREVEVALQFNSVTTTPTNIPTGAVRWNPTNGYWEIRGASTWGPLILKYLIDVDKLDGQDGAYYNAWANLTGVPTTFAPSAHNHDTIYFTETESDTRFAGSLAVSGNTLLLKNPAGATLSTITVPFASAATNSTTTGGFTAGQNLRPTDGVQFTTGLFNGLVTAEDGIRIGEIGDATAFVDFWDNTAGVFRALQWTSSGSKWQLEDATGVLQDIFHAGMLPDWTEVAGKPSTFAPAAHGHAFTATYKLQTYGAVTATLDAYVGAIGELAYDTTTNRLRVYDGAAVGVSVAYLSDLSPYAPLSSHPLVGVPTAPTATAGTNTTQIATAAFVTAAVAPKANLTTNTFTGAQIGAVSALTSASASIAVNLATGNNFSHTTTANSTLATPSNPVAGQSGIITITQGATAYSLAFSTFWKFPGGNVPGLTANAYAVDTFAYFIQSATRATCQLIGDVR